MGREKASIQAAKLAGLNTLRANTVASPPGRPGSAPRHFLHRKRPPDRNDGHLAPLLPVRVAARALPVLARTHPWIGPRASGSGILRTRDPEDASDIAD
jgi:hypothetical protein